MNENDSSAGLRFVRRAVAVSLVIAAAATACIWLYIKARPTLLYVAARETAFAAEYEEMQEKLSRLEACADEAAYHQAVLELAEIADYNGDHDMALALLAQPAAADTQAYETFAAQAEALSQACMYHKALDLYEEGKYAQAARMAADVRQYAPAAALYQAAQSAYQASLPTPEPTATPTPEPTATPTPEPTVTPTPEPTAVPAAAAEATQTPAPVPTATSTPEPTATPTPTPTPAPTPTPQPTLLPEGRIAAGAAHTAVLRGDGTVAAFGDNTYGQTDVDGWQNVVYVAAGARHTLGLTADGRVLACGDNTYHQSDVSLFSGVQAIAAGDYDSAVLLAGGEVITTGYHDYPFLQETTGVQRVWAGSYGMLVQTDAGAQASHASLALDGQWQSAAVSRGYAIAIDEQGNTHSTTPLVPEWTDVARVSAGENAVLALTKDGQVLSHVFDGHNLCSFAFDQPVLALSAGANHYAFLLADGTLQIRYADGRVENHTL